MNPDENPKRHGQHTCWGLPLLFNCKDVCVAKFKQGRESTEDDPWWASPKSVTTDDQVEALPCNRWLTCDCPTHSAYNGHQFWPNWGQETVWRWVPWMLTPDQKLKRMDISRTLSQTDSSIDLWPNMIHGFTTLIQNQRIKANNRNTSALLLPKILDQKIIP